MRIAIVYAFLAVVPSLCLAGDDPKPKPQPPAQAEQQQPPTPPPKEPAGSPILPAKPAPSGEAPADPAKMAPAAGGKVPNSVPVNEKTYIIGAEDMVRVMVWNNTGLSNDFLVRPDGRISIPLIGDVTAAGLTPEQLEASIRSRLKESQVLVDPQVSVGLAAVRSKKYFIQGAVMRPGPYDLVVPTTVLEGLVNSGGFRDFADEKHIRILHKDGSFSTFNYKDVIKGKHPEQNILLQDRDIIIIKD